MLSIKSIAIWIWNILIKIFVWGFNRQSFAQIKSALSMAGVIFGEGKIKKIIEMINDAQNMVDSMCKLLPNNQVEELEEKINKNEEKLGFGNFSATLVKDKHSEGNHGIVLGYKDDNINIEHDITNGGFKGSVDLNF